MTNDQLALELPPENGLQGLWKYWRYDIVAGMIVSYVSLPLSLGIAVASGAPPIAGLISAIIAGLVYPCTGGAYVTISGPAAGLAPVLISSMLALGAGSQDPEAGYRRLLAVISIVGGIQILLSLKPVAKRIPVASIAAMFPLVVVKGMLAAIGLLVINKQFPYVLGVKFTEHDFFPVLGELPSKISMVDANSLAVSTVCTITIFTLSACSRRWKRLRIVPPQLVVVLLGSLLGWRLGMSKEQLIHLPDNPFVHGIMTPDYPALFSGGIPLTVIGACLIKILFVDAIESLATIRAIDGIDPYHRKSDPNKTLGSMGICNWFSSIFGGLTIIPGGIKSTANIMAGGKTLNANFFNAVFLILYLVFLREGINRIPYAALAAILLHIGWKLCKPAIWFAIVRVSKTEFLAFSTTVGLSLYEDLLWGILGGTIVHYCVAVIAVHKNSISGASIFGSAIRLFRNPIAESVTIQDADRINIQIHGPLTCFNIRYVIDALRRIPEGIEICLIGGHLVPVLDCSAANDLARYRHDNKGKRVFEIQGLELEKHLLSFGSEH